jgi:hypothetical protein
MAKTASPPRCLPALSRLDTKTLRAVRGVSRLQPKCRRRGCGSLLRLVFPLPLLSKKHGSDRFLGGRFGPEPCKPRCPERLRSPMRQPSGSRLVPRGHPKLSFFGIGIGIGRAGTGQRFYPALRRPNCAEKHQLLSRKLGSRQSCSDSRLSQKPPQLAASFIFAASAASISYLTSFAFRRARRIFGSSEPNWNVISLLQCRQPMRCHPSHPSR